MAFGCLPDTFGMSFGGKFCSKKTDFWMCCLLGFGNLCLRQISVDFACLKTVFMDAKKINGVLLYLRSDEIATGKTGLQLDSYLFRNGISE